VRCFGNPRPGKKFAGSKGYSKLNYPFGVVAVAFSPDSRFILLAAQTLDKEGLQLWEIATNAKIWESTEMASEVAFSPDGKLIAVPNYAGADLLDSATGNKSRSLKLNKGVPNFASGIAFSPDGRSLVNGVRGSAIIWDLATGEVTKRFEGNSNYVSSLALSADGRFILAEPNDPLIEKEKAVLWDTASGKVVQSLTLDSSEGSPMRTHPEFSPEGKFLLLSDKRLWDLSTSSVVRNFKQPRLADGSRLLDYSFAFSPNGRFLSIGGNGNQALLLDTATGQEIRRFKAPVPPGKSFDMNSVAFSPDARFMLSGSDGGLVHLWEVETGKEIRTLQGHEWNVNAVAFSPDGRLAVSGSYDRTARLWDLTSGTELIRFKGHSGEVLAARFSPDGSMVLTGSSDGTARLWDTRTGQELRRFEGHAGAVHSARFLPDGRLALTGGSDYTARLWDVSSGRELCRLITFHDGTWAVVDTDGRFDTNNLDGIQDLHWVLPDAPFTPLPLEIFMREYYEPRLLQRIVAGERLKPVKAISELNRLQPSVRISSIQAQPNSDESVSVSVEVANVKGMSLRGASKEQLSSGVFDLRLFRDGQLVAYAPESGGEVKTDPRTGKTSVKFTNIKLPRQTDVKRVEFSAYAFNVDRVKSATDRKTFDLPKTLAPVKGRAYLISFGVNAYEQPDFDLSFAANDATRFQDVVYQRLSKTDEYSEIVQVPLVSDYNTVDGKHIVKEKSATRGNLKAVFDLLSGKPVPREAVAGIPGADKIRPARPEDLIMISFSSHGFADDAGNFYFVPYDTGRAREDRITPELVSHCVSSDELAMWLRDVDAGEMVMIADACHSAATVDAEGFKPGPMGSRGLGQLAYDKRMRILTSTQSNDVALESELIKQGLLTYALTHDGIEAGQADFKPKDKIITLGEWLEYGVVRVPSLYEEVKKGELKSFGRGEKRGLVVGSTAKNDTAKKGKSYQQPSLFDFSRRAHDVELVKAN
jgi:WD40 repeat protein